MHEFLLTSLSLSREVREYLETFATFDAGSITFLSLSSRAIRQTKTFIFGEYKQEYNCKFLISILILQWIQWPSKLLSLFCQTQFVYR